MSSSMTRTTKRGITVNIREDCADPSTSLFFVHGSMASQEQWRFQIKFFSSKYRIVSYDFYGCGSSPKPDLWDEYSTEKHLQDLIEIFDENKTTRNFLIGHSFGASLCLMLASQRKEINGLVLIAPALFEDGGHPIFRLQQTFVAEILCYQIFI